MLAADKFTNGTTDLATTQSKFGRRFDEEFKRAVVALASRPGASDTPVARDLGVSPSSVGRWKKLCGLAPAAASVPGVSVAEPERRIRALERECADLRDQRTMLKRRWRPRTTDRRHLCPIAPNRLAARAQPPARPGQGWQADITGIATKEGWLYVAGVLDACSRRIVGWTADDALPTALVSRAFERAVQAQQPAPGLLHRSA